MIFCKIFKHTSFERHHTKYVESCKILERIWSYKVIKRIWTEIDSKLSLILRTILKRVFYSHTWSSGCIAVCCTCQWLFDWSKWTSVNVADQEKPNKANSNSNIRIGTEAENVSFTSKNTTSGKCELLCWGSVSLTIIGKFSWTHLPLFVINKSELNLT